MDATTRQIIAFHVGDRRGESGKALWANIPTVYREQATFHTDQYDVYKGVIPAEQHRAITKKARKTNHIERFNNTLRQRVSRLVRETLSFSKKLARLLLDSRVVMDQVWRNRLFVQTFRGGPDRWASLEKNH